jgi:NAD(P)-dependent dehydrogenase (short-subunit alcohol dehydrogenase family)
MESKKRNEDWRGLPLPIDKSMPASNLKSCYEKTRGMFYFARMCSKIRARAEGALPEEYLDMLGHGFDGRTCRYLGVAYEDVRKLILAGNSDEDTLAWCLQTGRNLTDEDVLIFNSFMSKRGWHDDETDEFIPAMIKEYGLPNDGTVVTDFDLIERDEGRWYPDMWRDAWK